MKINRYINREISWLAFNDRVLQEAADRSVPLLERLKFLGIYSSNLDEFFSVRVGTLNRMRDPALKTRIILGGSLKKILQEIQKIVLIQRDSFEKIFLQLQQELRQEKIFIIDEQQLSEEQKKFVASYFELEVRPRLVPIMLNSTQHFPYLKNQVIYLAIHMSKSLDAKERNYALIEVPADLLPRFIVIPGKDENKFIIMLDDVIRYGLKEIFAIFDFDRIEAYTIKLTRDAEFDIDDDITLSFFEKIAKSIKQRQKGEPVRFVYDRKIPTDLLNFILQRAGLKRFRNLVPGGRYHNAKDFMNFPHIGPATLEYPKRLHLRHKDLISYRSLFMSIKEKDKLLQFPYHSFQYVIDLLREAAIDPKVSSIKMTIYRVAKNSNVINALINASRNGKSVTVVMELQARFDEEANIYWTRRLEEENVHIINGVPGLKVHAKLLLITRKEGHNKPVQYAFIGTGNFNESTAKVYCDHALFTANKNITREVDKVFDFLETNYKNFTYKHLLVSPFYMRKKIFKYINAEIKRARAGKEAYLYAKLNSLVDKNTIDKLYEASAAGVKISLIIRGQCSLVPGLPGLSENIRAISIVDKYLEHSRLFIFCNNGDERYYLSSADWMIRNLDNRVEVAVPIYDPEIQKEIRQVFDCQLRDNTKARFLTEKLDNEYVPKPAPGEKRHHAQEDLYDLLKKQLERARNKN